MQPSVLWGKWLDEPLDAADQTTARRETASATPTGDPIVDRLMRAALLRTSVPGEDFGVPDYPIQTAVWRSMKMPDPRSVLGDHALHFLPELNSPDAHRNESVLAYLVEVDRLVTSPEVRLRLPAYFDAILDEAQLALSSVVFPRFEGESRGAMRRLAAYIVGTAREALVKQDKRADFTELIQFQYTRAIEDQWPIEAALLIDAAPDDLRSDDAVLSPIASVCVDIERSLGICSLSGVSQPVVASFYEAIGRAYPGPNALTRPRYGFWCGAALYALAQAETALARVRLSGLCLRMVGLGMALSSYLKQLDASGGPKPELLVAAANKDPVKELSTEAKIALASIGTAFRAQLQAAEQALRAVKLSVQPGRALIYGQSKDARAACSLAVALLVRAARFNAWSRLDKSGEVERLIRQTHFRLQNVTIAATLELFYPPLLYTREYRAAIEQRLSFNPKTIEDEIVGEITFFVDRRQRAYAARDLPDLAENRFAVPLARPVAFVTVRNELNKLTAPAQSEAQAAPPASPPAKKKMPMAPPKASGKQAPPPKQPPPEQPPAPKQPPPEQPPVTPVSSKKTIEEAIQKLTKNKFNGAALIGGPDNLVQLSDLSMLKGFDLVTDAAIEPKTAAFSTGLMAFALKYTAGIGLDASLRKGWSWAVSNSATAENLRSWDSDALDQLPGGEGDFNAADTIALGAIPNKATYAKDPRAKRENVLVALAPSAGRPWSLVLVRGEAKAYHIVWHAEDANFDVAGALAQAAVPLKEGAVPKRIQAPMVKPDAFHRIPYLLVATVAVLLAEAGANRTRLEQILDGDGFGAFYASLKSLGDPDEFARRAIEASLLRIGNLSRRALALKNDAAIKDQFINNKLTQGKK